MVLLSFFRNITTCRRAQTLNRWCSHLYRCICVFIYSRSYLALTGLIVNRYSRLHIITEHAEADVSILYRIAFHQHSAGKHISWVFIHRCYSVKHMVLLISLNIIRNHVFIFKHSLIITGTYIKISGSCNEIPFKISFLGIFPVNSSQLKTNEMASVVKPLSGHNIILSLYPP